MYRHSQYDDNSITMGLPCPIAVWVHGVETVGVCIPQSYVVLDGQGVIVQAPWFG